MQFVDEVQIKVESGAGGKGCTAFNRRNDKKVVPNGGDGGHGGDIIIEADSNADSLYPYLLNPSFKAESGHQGGGSDMAGRCAGHLTLKVPVGTLVFSKEDHLLLRDLSKHGEQLHVVRGGRGGLGNHRQGHEATPGEPSKSLELILSLCIGADVFMLGYPNVGKSALLSKITNSHVKVVDYPFSTRFPHLGTLETEDYKLETFCELPGLLPGASEGKGLGNHFLKHLSRAKTILILLDPTQPQSVAEQWRDVNQELRMFDARYFDAPKAAVITKIDVAAQVSSKNLRELEPKPLWVKQISSQTGIGIDALMKKIQENLDAFISI